ncbi:MULTISPECIES: sodium:solute symporter family transporter [unclassified Arcicella]|uniref:sodium:solute symporter family transporter n=1 Tax=unclassified Arcicella TaxID=2644986 RepID=UPI0028626F32|nr:MULTISPECIES: sodium/solute symporter [unclassified Arcicella]MDR6561991.1 SSS family solute:Na+ symporter [Arcicella sp. BE51]MDR6811862.1 SSS family solute:Na+ symporter [Arcicella sp. BE140]MDR6822892.1 SSS family solute:Na+ symporter [Arcicella sp. BE139]
MMGNIVERLTFLDYSIVVAYLVILIVIGYRASFSDKTNKDETLFLANKSLGWSSIGFNMWGTNVGPSMLLAFASIGYSTGIVAVNFDWYAFVFLFLLAIVFAPKYLAANVTTMPEFMGKRYGDSTQTILAWYALIKILISWLSLGLFAGGFLVRQILGIPMWQSVIVLVLFAGLFAFAGGLKAIAKVNVFQMILLIAVSLTLTILGVIKVGGVSEVYHKVPAHYWTLIHPASDTKYPWYAILLGYPVAAVAFFCTDQAMVQSVLGAKNLEQGQLGVNFIAWLKILSLPLFILTGILCYILFPNLKDPSEAYMTMVTNLFPPGMNGLVIVVLIAVLVGTIGSSLNSLSTVFTMDVYLKKINPQATNQEIIKVGRYTVIAGCIFAIMMALAIDSIKGLNLFDVFQSVLGFIAPPLAVVFLLTVFWKRTTKKAVNFTLSAGSVVSLGVGVMYLWVFTPDKYPIWPHYLLLSFLIFAFLFVLAVIISLLDNEPTVYLATFEEKNNIEKPTKKVWISWLLLTIVMIALYLFFN